MCGLVGCAGSIAKKEKDAFKLMLHLDIIRGKHSTGVASVETSGNWSLVKKAGTAWDLFDVAQFNTMMKTTSYALIGHNRAATKGKVNNVNAHPFEFQDVVGAHNGTLRGQWRLPDSTRFEVDSENIFYAIQQEGLDSTLQKLDGAYALTYWDKRTEELVLIRNQERTLFYCFSKDLKTVFWASEAWMLSIALSRSGLEFTEILPVTEESIYRFSFERKFTSTEGVSLTIQGYEEPVFPVAYKTTTYNSNRNKGTAQQGKHMPAPGDKEKKKRELKGSGLKVSPQGLVNRDVEFIIIDQAKTEMDQDYFICELLVDSAIDVRLFISNTVKAKYKEIMAVSSDTIFVGNAVSYRDGTLYISPTKIEEAEIEEEEDADIETVPGYNGRSLSFHQFREATQRGCCACGEQVLWDDAQDIVWSHSDEFICPACKELAWVKEYLME